MTAHHLDGNRIQQIRKTKGDTLRTVSEATGISISALCDIEHNRSSLSMPNAVALAQHYNVALEQLLKGHAMTNDFNWFQTKLAHAERKTDAYRTDVKIAELRIEKLQQLLGIADQLVAASLAANGIEFAKQRTAYLTARADNP